MTDQAASGQTPPVGSMFSLGWLMAQLFGPLQHRRARDSHAHLPTLAELGAEDYMPMAFLELEKLLAPYPDLSDADLKTTWISAGHQGFTEAVADLHQNILDMLVLDPPQLSAYQLGRALSDTCWLPDKEMGGEFVLEQFDRHRLATLDAWIASASSALPDQSAGTISRSLQNWQDWAEINAKKVTTGWADAYRSVIAALRSQALAWHALLSAETDSNAQPGIDAWVYAGQSILRTTRQLMLTILRRFWLLVVIIAAATGGLLYLAIANTTGTEKVWTSLVTVAAAAGITGTSLRAAATKASGTLEQDIRDAATLDARAWAVTWLPTLPQSRLQQYRLANRGVAVPQAGTHLELATEPGSLALAAATYQPKALRPAPPE